MQQLLAVVRNVICLKKNLLSAALLSDLRNNLTRENPNYHLMKRMADRNPRKRFAALPPKTITSYEEDATTFYIPRGFKSNLIEIAAEHGNKIQFIDETISFQRNPAMQMKTELQLKDYQKKALGKLVITGEGIVTAPCGGGKTVTGIAIAMTLKQPTLILVHTVTLLTQWVNELTDKAYLPEPVATYGAGKNQIGNVTVGIVQAVTRMIPPALRQFLSSFGCVILDEAHHCPAVTFLGIMNHCYAKYRFGLTATPKRKDGIEFLMFDTIGPVVFSITDDDLRLEGRSQSCSVRTIITSTYSEYTASSWNNLIDDLIENRMRNELIVDNVVQTWNQGHFSLVISDRVSHCFELDAMLKSKGMNSQLLVGAVDKKKRDWVVEQSKKNLVDVIVATKVADEGLDIPSLSCIHLTTPTGNDQKIQQRVGRIRRPQEGKTSLIADYVDSRIETCLRMFKLRRNLYRRLRFTKEDGTDL